MVKFEVDKDCGGSCFRVDSGGFGVFGETSVVDRRVFRYPGEAPFGGLRW